MFSIGALSKATGVKVPTIRYYEEIGVDIKWKASGGCCDGNNIAAAGIPVIDTLGARGANIHSADEYVKLESLEERARLSAALLLRIAAGDIPVPGSQAAERAR